MLTGGECPEQTDAQSVTEGSTKPASKLEKGGGNAYAFCMLTNYINGMDSWLLSQLEPFILIGSIPISYTSK